jgi:hypothetical protein
VCAEAPARSPAARATQVGSAPLSSSSSLRPTCEDVPALSVSTGRPMGLSQFRASRRAHERRVPVPASLRSPVQPALRPRDKPRRPRTSVSGRASASLNAWANCRRDPGARVGCVASADDAAVRGSRAPASAGLPPVVAVVVHHRSVTPAPHENRRWTGDPARAPAVTLKECPAPVRPRSRPARKTLCAPTIRSDLALHLALVRDREARLVAQSTPSARHSAWGEIP